MDQEFRALVADDEAAVRKLAVRALKASGFVCEEAADGNHAAELLCQRNYDVVVTDLRMPKRNGHSLAVDVLARGTDRPLVVILTGVLEGRLAADLIARGVDDITFKPVDFGVFAAKVRALCARRQRQSNARAQEVVAAPASHSTDACISNVEIHSITMEEIEQRLDSLAGSLPVSLATVEMVNRIETGSLSIEEVARLIARDSLLTLEVLRLANSAHNSPGSKRIDDLQQAIARVGERQIGEIALASMTLRGLADKPLCGINVEVSCRRSLASSRIITLLHSAAEIGADDEGLFLSSLLLPMSRVLLGLAFPELYQRMIAHCKNTGCSLTSVEQDVLPIGPARAMAGMLARWNLTPRLFKPLQHAGRSYCDLATATEPLRSKVERLRVAELLGQLAVGHFEPWDHIDFPLPQTMRRLRVDDLGNIVAEARTEHWELSASGISGPSTTGSAPPRRDREISYFKLGMEPHDFLAHLLDALNIKTVRISREAACKLQPVVVNCLDVSQERLEWFLDDAIPNTSRPLVCNAPLPAHFEPWGPVVQLPCSFAALAKVITCVHSDSAFL